MNHENTFLPRGPSPELSEDFQGKVFLKIRHHQRKKSALINVGVFLAAMGVTLFFRQSDEVPVKQGNRVLSAARGVDWLVQSRNPEGDWDIAQWGGQAAFEPGVKALATLALLNAPNPVPSEVLSKAVKSTEDSLAEMSEHPGRGPEFYNYMLTLYTLGEAEKLMPDTGRSKRLQEAYTRLVRSQHPGGGWGYPESRTMGYGDGAVSNTAVSWWVHYVLTNRPAKIQVIDSSAALSRGSDWLQAQKIKNGTIVYNRESSMSADSDDALYWMMELLKPESGKRIVKNHDAYRDFFRIQASQDTESLERLHSLQQPDGSWQQQDDRWWKAGGRVYVTALSVLCQVPGGA